MTKVADQRAESAVGSAFLRRAWVIGLAVLAATAMLTRVRREQHGGRAPGPPAVGSRPASRMVGSARQPGERADQRTMPVRPGGQPERAVRTRRAGFVEGTAIPTVVEVLAAGPKAQQTWRSLGQALARCRTATITITGKKATATIRPLPFPRVASTSSAYAWAFTTAGVRIGLDLVLFEAGAYAGYLTYADLGAPAVATVQAFALRRWRRRETGSTAQRHRRRSRSRPRRCGSRTPGWARSPTAPSEAGRPWS